MRKLLASLAMIMSLALTAQAQAEDYVITIKDHQFAPQELVIPANQKIKITVKNLDAAPIEFESHELKREKIIGANSQAVIMLGPLKAGSYGYFDEFHSTSKGTITAK